MSTPALPGADWLTQTSQAVFDFGLIAIGVFLLAICALTLWLSLTTAGNRKTRFWVGVGASLFTCVFGIALAVIGILVEPKYTQTYLVEIRNVPVNVDIRSARASTFVRSTVPTMTESCYRDFAIALVNANEAIEFSIYIRKASEKCRDVSPILSDPYPKIAHISFEDLRPGNNYATYRAQDHKFYLGNGLQRSEIKYVRSWPNHRNTGFAYFGNLISAAYAGETPQSASEQFDYAMELFNSRDHDARWVGATILGENFELHKSAIYAALSESSRNTLEQQGLLTAIRYYFQSLLRDAEKNNKTKSGNGPAQLVLPEYSSEFKTALMSLATSDDPYVRGNARALIRSKPNEEMVKMAENYARKISHDVDKIKAYNGVRADLYYNYAFQIALEEDPTSLGKMRPTNKEDSILAASNALQSAFDLMKESLEEDKFLFAKAKFGEGLLALKLGIAFKMYPKYYSVDLEESMSELKRSDLLFDQFLDTIVDIPNYPYSYHIAVARKCRVSIIQAIAELDSCLSDISPKSQAEITVK